VSDPTSPGTPTFRVLVATAEQRFGPIDILVNNASLFAALRTKPFEQIEEDEWDTVMRVNVRGAFQAVKAVAPSMDRADGGKIINISSCSLPAR
jgi:NAD(P)-dependent dehydrogenase (short-subunit alcohol dehydrogenase family)